MNILFYLYQYPAIGGIEVVTATICRGLSTAGHNVHIVSHIGRDETNSACQNLNGVQTVRMPSSDYYCAENKRYLQKYIADNGIEVIVFQDSYAPIERNLFVDGLQCKVIVCEHNSPFYIDENTQECRGQVISNLKLLRNRLGVMHRLVYEYKRRRFLYNRCWRYALLSDRFYGEFKALTLMSACEKLVTLHNPLTVRPEQMQIIKKNEIVFVGTVNHRKGCDLLYSIVAPILDKYPEWAFRIVGDGPYLNSLKTEFSAYKQVYFEGYVSAPDRFLANAKIFIFPSRREGWGLVLLEGMSSGCVPVAFESYASLRDIISDGHNGYISPPFSKTDMRLKIERLICDNELWQRMSFNARNHASKFSLDRILCEWERLLSSAGGEE